MKTKYRIMLLLPGSTCCGPEEYINIGTTYDPIEYQKQFPALTIRFEQVILGKIIIFNTK